jgi:hypothetical protein
LPYFLIITANSAIELFKLLDVPVFVLGWYASDYCKKTERKQLSISGKAT